MNKASKFLVARVMKTRTAAEMNRVSIAAFDEMPVDKRRTFIFDNGKEFSGHEHNPYHSWERGLNEHTNGLIR